MHDNNREFKNHGWESLFFFFFLMKFGRENMIVSSGRVGQHLQWLYSVRGPAHQSSSPHAPWYFKHVVLPLRTAHQQDEEEVPLVRSAVAAPCLLLIEDSFCLLFFDTCMKAHCCRRVMVCRNYPLMMLCAYCLSRIGGACSIWHSIK